MLLNSLSLSNFKNIESAHLEFSPKINCFLGDNGMGKSNLLDALHLLSYCRSFTGVTDAQLIRRGDSFAMLNGRYTRRGIDEELAVGIQPGRRKSFKRAGKEYRRLSDHVGLFPLVLLSPADMSLISGEPAERRRLVDSIAGQSDPQYLEALLRYSDAIEQRNRLLRDECRDSALYDAIELQMDMAAAYLCRQRAKTITELQPILAERYASIAPSELPLISYAPSLHEDADKVGALADALAARRERDLILGYTSVGPHRDEINMELDSAPVRRVASQGQSKTFTTALRLAQFELMHRQMGLSPLLLLDDIFDKLDTHRVESIIAAVANGASFGQIFITDTNRRHLDETVRQIGSTDSRLWEVHSGNFSQITL